MQGIQYAIVNGGSVIRGSESEVKRNVKSEDQLHLGAHVPVR